MKGALINCRSGRSELDLYSVQTENYDVLLLFRNQFIQYLLHLLQLKCISDSDIWEWVHVWVYFTLSAWFNTHRAHKIETKSHWRGVTIGICLGHVRESSAVLELLCLRSLLEMCEVLCLFAGKNFSLCDLDKSSLSKAHISIAWCEISVYPKWDSCCLTPVCQLIAA